MAATGGTRVARTAGTSAATSVTPMPTARPMTIVRGASSMPAARDAQPGGVEQRAERAREARARRAGPATDATDAEDEGLGGDRGEDLPPRRAQRAQQRELARRWATVIEKVLKMMNAPTSSAAPEKASSTGVRKLPMLSLICFGVVGGGLLAGLDLEAARQRLRAGAPRARSGVTPGAAEATTRVTLPSRPYQACTSAIGATISVAPPIEATLP